MTAQPPASASAQDATAFLRGFRSSLIEDVYAPRDVVPWVDIDTRTAELEPGIRAWQEAADRAPIDTDLAKAALVASPASLEVVRSLLSLPASLSFANGRKVPETLPEREVDVIALAELLIAVGVGRVLTPGVDVSSLIRVALIAADARRRGYRRRSVLEARISGLIDHALRDATDALNLEVHAVSPADLPSLARARCRVAIRRNGRTVAAIATVFETLTGGRQTATLREFIAVQDELDAVPAGLIVVADGAGVRSASTAAITDLWQRVSALMNLQQAETGALAQAIAELSRHEGVKPGRRLPSSRIVDAVLKSASEVSIEDLQLNADAGRLALARYNDEHPDLGLDLLDGGARLRFTRANDVRRADELKSHFDPTTAVGILADLIGARAQKSEEEGDVLAVGHLVPATSVLPEQMALAASSAPTDVAVVGSAATVARRLAPEATIAALVVPDTAAWLQDPARTVQQRASPTSVVVVDPRWLRTVATSRRSPLEALAEQILEQADLVKVSPFVYSGHTPARTFAGREIEIAEMLDDLATSSVAVLGSRRMGKTSLMRRLEGALEQQSRPVFFLDCQAVGDWESFVAALRRRLGVRLSASFDPDQLAELIDQLSNGNGTPVLLLDETDALLEWDRTTTTRGVEEAFSKQLRSLSQDRSAQFVFSGERTIAERISSARSPHWNFCLRLMLRQLTQDASHRLLFDVLADLSISFDDAERAAEIGWEATSGHPRLVQLLGDRLVRSLNDQSRTQRNRLEVAVMNRILAGFEYCDEYVDTYWGQATPVEKHLSRAIAAGRQDRDDLQEGLQIGSDELDASLEILELYGVLDRTAAGPTLRAEYLPRALDVVEGDRWRHWPPPVT